MLNVNRRAFSDGVARDWRRWRSTAGGYRDHGLARRQRSSPGSATIGYARVERFTPITVIAIRVLVEETIAPVGRLTLRLFAVS